MHVCMECYEIYNVELLNREHRDGYEWMCPKQECSGSVVELDELISPSIILLNQKGYLTKFCCSGHWYDSCFSPYIYFYEDCMPDSMPEGFVLEEERNTIRWMSKDGEYLIDEKEKFTASLEIARVLYDWVCGLEEIEW